MMTMTDRPSRDESAGPVNRVTCRLSVILPFYDETAFVQMALSSVLSQGIDGVEVIVVNDNPERFDAGRFARLELPATVRVIHHPRNLGLSAARNTGMAAAEGRRIAFLDSDDYYLAGGLAAQLALAEESGADVTHANACLSAVGSPALRVLPRDKALFPVPRQGAGLAGIEQAQFITSSWSSVYRADFLARHNLRFDEEQTKFEDRLFVLQSVVAAERIACLGAPARVWRRRTGSISVSRADLPIHLLQVQLLEKCMAVMRAQDARPGTPARFLRRETFNTVSRLIWDMDVIPHLASGTEGYAPLGARIVALLGEDRFGQQVFDDPVLSLVSRVGMKTRKGLVRRQDFFSLHRQLREGDFAGAAATLAACNGPVPAPAVLSRRRGRHLVLHLGMHKTGSTWLQRNLMAAAEPLRRAGAIFPRSGLMEDGYRPIRRGGFPGHLGLFAAARDNRDGPWDDLHRELAASRAQTVILSCENMLAPVQADRDAVLDRLFRRLSGFESCRVVALVRRPDDWAEVFWRELVCNGHRMGARSLPEFLVDFGDLLTDLPRIFAPFEAFCGQPVHLADHEALAADGRHWQGFLAAAGLDAALPAGQPGQSPTYRTPGREQILAARLVNAMVASDSQRADVLRAFFAGQADTGRGASFLPPEDRLHLLERFQAQSADWAAARGYRPDLAALRAELAAEDWAPVPPVPVSLLEQVQQARLQAEQIVADVPSAAPALARKADAPPPDRALTIRITPRPWMRRLLERFGR